MLIANPTYDVVFKYFLEDNKLAKLFLGVLLEVTILELEFLPQEVALKVNKSSDEDRLLTIMRMDFKARISDSRGNSRLVIIELQKTKNKADMFRFRNYLGSQYQNPENSIEVNGVKLPLPIISIYFLGFNLELHQSIPVIKVKRNYLDSCTGDILRGDVPFIEMLTHDAIIVQLAALKKRRRFEIEKILSIFDVSAEKFIEVNEKEYPPAFVDFLTRLHNVMKKPEVIRDLVYEEALNREYMENYREAKMLREKVLLLEEQQRKQEEQQRKQEEQQRKQEEQQRKQEEQQRKQELEACLREELLLKKSVFFMVNSGLLPDKIAEVLGKTEVEIRKVIESEKMS